MAYNYSPIKKLYIKNFRNLGEVTIDFSESPIVSLIGENESGKTSVVKAFSVCALHSSPRDQKDYIRDGTDGFGVAIELEDNTLITRVKRQSLNWYSLKNPDGTVWNTSKIEGGLPPAIQKVLGLIEEPETKEYLQVRTYEDQLLFVVTPASTNYKVMYDALKVDQLTRAIKTGSKEANSLKSEIDNNEYGIATLTQNLRQIRIVDITHLINIKHRIENEVKSLEAIEEIASLNEELVRRAQEDKLFAKIQNLDSISEVEITKILNIQRSVSSVQRNNHLLEKYREADGIQEVDYSLVDKLRRAAEKASKVRDLEKSVHAFENLEALSEISIETLNKFTRISYLAQKCKKAGIMLSKLDVFSVEEISQADLEVCNKIKRMIALKDRNDQLETALKQIDNYCKQVSDYLRSLDVAVEICPRCGESIVVDLEKYQS